MTTMAAAAIQDVIAPMWVEVSFMVFFILGFLVLRADRFSKRLGKKGRKASLAHQLHKTIEAEVASGNPVSALKAWRTKTRNTVVSAESLKMISQVLIDEEPDSLVADMVEHIGAHREQLANSKTSNAILDVVARSGSMAIMEELATTLQSRFQIQPTIQTQEIMMGGYASVGDAKNVAKIVQQLGRNKISARAYSLLIKGFLKNNMTDEAFLQIQNMQAAGFYIPSFAVAQLFRTAVQSGRVAETFEKAFAPESKTQLQLPAEAVTVLLEDCLKRDDVELALRVEESARNGNTPLAVSAYDALLKLCVNRANIHALRVFDDMEKEGVRISEGLCVGLLARCADSKFLRFAEKVAKFVRGRDGMTIAVYSALMKVYAYCGMYDQACDLYAQLREDGLEPDSMMYGCLMKFSVECGRTELSQKLFDKAPTLDIQNYMSLIRAAGHDHDVDRAFAILDKLKASGVSADIAAYNCVLDACVSACDVKRARQLVNEMQTLRILDIITYNTLLKGYCAVGDIKSAKELFSEMENVGLPPNDVSYNCLINAAVSKGFFREAWDSVDTMERKGVPVDRYTVSIMMKALKKAKDVRDIGRTFQLLDRAKLDVCSDEVLLNTVLETCIRHRELQRVSEIISSMSQTQMQPSIHTYGSLIKACSLLKRLDQCWEFWRDMVERRALQPNDIVLGCMLDALVCNNRIDEAVNLFKAWKAQVPPNTVMYSTLIKGFANSRQAARAMEFWEEMKAGGMPMNTVAYNALIDAQARVGALDEVHKLLSGMDADGCRPDGITYSTIVKGYCVRGELDKAMEVFRTMQSNSMAVDCVIYNTMLDGCTRHNRMDLADQVLEDMERLKVRASNFTLGILIKMYGKQRRLDKVFEVVAELPKKHGITPNAQVSTCLIGACLNNGDVDRALQVFEEFKASDAQADSKTYGALIAWLARHDQAEKAVAILNDACELRRNSKHTEKLIEPQTLEQLLRALMQKGLMQTLGLPMIKRLREVGVHVNAKHFSSALMKRDD
jgi:pentatricopeptide repeat protein